MEWKVCKFNGKEYIIKHCTTENTHKLYVSDVKKVWFEEISEDRLLQRCKEMNRLLETCDSELMNLVWSLVEGEGDNITSSFTDDVSGKQLHLQTNLDGLLKFRIKFMLQLADPEEFFKKFSCPLLILVSELEKRNRLLIDIIKKKDLEIAEYKLEGAKISRGAVETEVFDAESFSKKCDGELGATKGLVQNQPSLAFTPFITQLLENTENAPVIIRPKENHEEVLKNCKKTGPMKLNSPIKAKKTKMYEDEEDENSDKEASKKEEGTANLDLKKEQKSKPSKKETRPKVKKVLSNL